MTQIIIDSRRCGEGKTYDLSPTAVTDLKGNNLSTWANIKQRHRLGDRCLVVLPSKALCDRYEQELAEFVAVASPFDTDNQLKKITSDNSSNVQRQLHQALNENCAIIIITQAAFLQSQILSTQRDYYLIIDEAIMPYREVAVYHEQDCLVDFNWATNASCLVAPDGAVEWNELRFHNLQGNFITDQAETTRFLFNDNWRCRVHRDDFDKFAGVIPKNQRISVIQELRPELFMGWRQVWIACAAFEYTFMCHWMTAHNIAYTIHKLLPFKPHTVKLTIHGPDDLKWSWSNYKQQNYPEIIQQYIQQVKPLADAEGVLILRNNDQTRQIFDLEQRLPHNSAGSNDYSSFEYISLESALNPTPTMTRFLTDVYGLARDPRQDPVHMAQTVYTFYQTIMRSCLRNDEPATVFCLDNRVIMGLSEFFTNIEFSGIALDFEAAELGRPQTTQLGRALSAAERNFIARKRRYPQYQSMTNEEILALKK